MRPCPGIALIQTISNRSRTTKTGTCYCSDGSKSTQFLTHPNEDWPISYHLPANSACLNGKVISLCDGHPESSTRDHTALH